MSGLTDEQIIKVAQETATAEAGRDGYILPIRFARAVIAADRALQPKECDVCGYPCLSGRRHRQCGESIMAAEKMAKQPPKGYALISCDARITEHPNHTVSFTYETLAMKNQTVISAMEANNWGKK